MTDNDTRPIIIALTAIVLAWSMAWRSQSMRTTAEGNSPSEREPFRIALFDRVHRLASQPGEGG